LGGKRLLVDPWLEGVEVDFFGWFNTQWHRTPPVPWEALPPYDGVLITQKYSDHFHGATLGRLGPSTIFAPPSLATRISRGLPSWTPRLFTAERTRLHWGDVTLHWLRSRRRLDPIYDAFLLDDGVQSLMIAPHGISLDDVHLETIAGASPCAALLSPFNAYRLPAMLGGVVAPGLSGLERLMAQMRPRVVVATHDEDKHARGLIPRLARIERFTEDRLGALPWLAPYYRATPDYSAFEV